MPAFTLPAAMMATMPVLNACSKKDNGPSEAELKAQQIEAKRQEVHQYWRDSIKYSQHINSLNYYLQQSSLGKPLTMKDPIYAAPRARDNNLAVDCGWASVATQTPCSLSTRKAVKFADLVKEFEVLTK